MRRRRPTRLRMRVDREKTAAMHFLDRDSYVALDGRHILFGIDANRAYDVAYARWTTCGKRLCAICGGYVKPGQEERDHIKSKGKNLRDDRAANQRFVHGRFSEENCHHGPRGHNREVQLRSIPLDPQWQHLGEP